MKTINKNRALIKINAKEFLIVDRVTIPKYYINGQEFTEYDMRKLQLEVSLGNVSHEVLNRINIVDEKGGRFVFREDGALCNTPYGYGTLSGFVLDMIKTRSNEDRIKSNRAYNTPLWKDNSKDKK